jgi:hypothetical protein
VGSTVAIKLSEHIAGVRSRGDLVAFVQALRLDLDSHPDEWENTQLGAFLEALASWLEDMDGYYANTGQPTPEPPTWKTFGEILLAAKYYE